VSKNEDHDFDDIDVFLRQDCAMSNSMKIKADAISDRERSHVDRLLARAAHINGDVAQTLDCVTQACASLDGDISLCEKLTFELTNCENAIVLLAQMLDDDLLSFEASPESSPTPETEAETEPATHLSPAIEPASAAATLPEPEVLLEQVAAQNELIRNLQNRLNALESGAEENMQAPSWAADNAARMFDEPYVNRVIIASNNDGNLKFPLDKNIVTIGREAQNDIHIRSKFISRFHARIVSDQGGAIIEDLGSRNGITVNSRKIRRHQLRSGDLIDLGKTQLKYIDLKEGAVGEGQA
jgi:hypothetical protein